MKKDITEIKERAKHKPNFSDCKDKVEKEAKIEFFLQRHADEYPLAAEVNLNDDMIDAALDRIAGCCKQTQYDNLDDYFRVTLKNNHGSSANFLMSRMNYQLVGMKLGSTWTVYIGQELAYNQTTEDTFDADLVRRMLSCEEEFPLFVDKDTTKLNKYGAFYILAISEAAKNMTVREIFFKMLYSVDNDKRFDVKELYRKTAYFRKNYDEISWKSYEKNLTTIITSNEKFYKELARALTAPHFDFCTQIITDLVSDIKEDTNIPQKDWENIISQSLKNFEKNRKEIRTKSAAKKGSSGQKMYLLGQMMIEIENYIKTSETLEVQNGVI